MSSLPGIFPSGKGDLRVGLTTLPLYVPTALKSGSLDPLEPLGPVQVCIWRAFLYRYVRVSTSEQDILVKNASGLCLRCTGLNLHYQLGIKMLTKHPTSGTETIIF
jgi:hypothetical protein